ncbi:hypothetical protein BCR43DRAFT_493700 [Syncephalastrum racemosum]|uniref:Uncharacterized protein n=1 Tax=Syncephalastrum racemosum TaxID=13706 RepID=A0A1X2HAZ7_SYNRA|nr:hypothetical protein BCR43DRAFT_493700 [Syncephalastrum racemosum]
MPYPPYKSDMDIEHYGSTSRPSRSEQRQSLYRRRQKQRHILFFFLILVCMFCIGLSYQVSSEADRLPCSNYIFWVPNCNREEYAVETTNATTPDTITHSTTK